MNPTSLKDKMRAAMRTRDERVIEARKRGLTLAEIGRREGITRQRVHQILAAVK
jgi:DNA-directed RNA polymerase sigma subunit (sigma70/sigma32)